jgi:hypothetical protein
VKLEECHLLRTSFHLINKSYPGMHQKNKNYEANLQADKVTTPETTLTFHTTVLFPSIKHTKSQLSLSRNILSIPMCPLQFWWMIDMIQEMKGVNLKQLISMRSRIG